MRINTYFRTWHLDIENGVAHSSENNFLYLRILGRRFKRRKNKFEIYNYFIEKNHIEEVTKESQNFFKKLNRYNIELKNKTILDVSGGNGTVLNFLRTYAKDAVLTEVNDQALEYARVNLNLKTLKYDFDEAAISYVLTKKHETDKNFPKQFDLILLRACVMFIKDIDSFFKDLKKVMSPDCHIVIEKSVWFTLGVALRTQFDDSSYSILRSHENMEQIILKNGFDIIDSSTEIDPTMYIFDHDKKILWRIMYIVYENFNLLKFKGNDIFNYRSRFRYRSDFYLKISSES
jgi:hypothetical protein